MRKLAMPMLAMAATLLLSSCGASTVTPLFNGEDFTGFEPLGGRAEFVVEDGALVGISTKGEPNSFVATTESYGDFILEFDMWNDTLLNSGVQIRSHSRSNGSKVYGYQCEIDPSDRAWSGGIYEEGGRGWLATLDGYEVGQKAYKREDWNHYRVEALGNNIRVWLNGVSTANLYDDRESEGFIAFQVHSAGGPKIGRKTMWKNITIDTVDVAKKRLKGGIAPEINRIPNTLTESEIEAGWELLFDGKSLDKWMSFNGSAVPAAWTVEDGAAYIQRGKKLPGGGIITKQEYSAFEFSVEFKLTPKANSGIKYFVKTKVDPQSEKNVTYGLEYQLMDNERYAGREGMDKYKLAGLYDMIAPGAIRFSGVKIWNQAVIKVFPNGHVEHWLNGFKVIEFERGSDEFRELVAQSKYSAPSYNIDVPFGEDESGAIMLQDHNDLVYFRNIKIRELK
ncbi:MAG: DUF1080 domain-containing protein [Rikenellaceae bacterium]